MTTFTDAERDYLDQRRLARLATVGRDGTPHITPVGMWRLAADASWVEIRGRNFAASKKYRDVAATGRAAIVVDDLASTDPWRPRGVEIRGAAEAISGSRRAGVPCGCGDRPGRVFGAGTRIRLPARAIRCGGCDVRRAAMSEGREVGAVAGTFCVRAVWSAVAPRVRDGERAHGHQLHTCASSVDGTATGTT